jgi:ribosomal protein L11 methyltransferase
MAVRSAPALDLRFPATPDAWALADRALALLDELQPTGIDEGTFPPDAADGPPQRWRVAFPTTALRDRAAEAILAALAPLGVEVSLAELADEDWAARFHTGWRALRVGRLIVAPPWDVPDDAAGPVVVIQPGRGFGTGHHPSTRLCLEALQRMDLTHRRVIDAGTGSGILAVAAAALGARAVVAVDHDPDALVSAADTIARNGAGDRVTLVGSDLAHLARLALPPADVVAANLTAALLVREAPGLWSLLVPGGRLVAGGLLADQVAHVRAAIRAAGGASVARTDTLEADGWAALVVERAR